MRTTALRPLAALVVCLASAAGAVRDVGPGYPYPTLGSLPALAAGDEVRIHPGTYREFKRWTNAGTAGAKIWVHGVGDPRPVIDASGFDLSGAMPTPRAALQVEASYVVLEHLDIRNGHNSSLNGAAVRITGSNVTGTEIRDCRMTSCDMGMMADNCDQTLVERCEIAYNGADPYSHNMYLSSGGSFTLRGNWVHHANTGQNVKVRAHYIELLYNRIEASAEGEIGLIDSGSTTAADSNAVLIGNVVSSVVRSANANNAKYVIFGQDTGGTRNGTLYAFNNTFIAAAGSNRILDTNIAGARLVASGNVFIGSGNTVTGGWASVSGSGNFLPGGVAGLGGSVIGTDPRFVNAGAGDYHLQATSPCRDVAPTGQSYRNGAGATIDGTATQEYASYGSLVARGSDGRPDAGAYEIPGVTVANQAPVARIGASAGGGVAPVTISFSGTGSSDADGSITAYAWTFGDGATASGASVSHAYAGAGSFTASLKVTDNAGASSTATTTIAVTAPPTPQPPTPQPPTSTGTGTGLTGEYFDNADLTALVRTRTDATVDFDWGGGSPDAAIGVDTFSVRWTGEVQAQTSETYTFDVLADDGVRVWVGGQLIVDRWIDQGPTACAGSIALSAGQRVAIRIEYYENGGGATCRLRWSTPTRALATIPTSQLYPASTSVATRSPYGGVARAIPGTIQAEDFDLGADGVAYHDLDASNNGGGYRSTGVDIRGCVDAGGGWQVGWMGAGEWLEYTVNVAAAGSYGISARVASGGSGATVHVSVDGADKTGAMTFGNTGGWDTWQTVTKAGASLPAGAHVVRLSVDAGSLDLNWLGFTAGPAAASGIVSGGWYKLLAQHSGKCLDVAGGSTADGANVQQWSDNGSTAQQWRIDAVGDGSWTLTARCSSEVLDLAGGSSADGANVVQWPSHGGANQHWRIEDAGGGAYRLVSVASGKVLEVTGASTADGANVDQWTDIGAGNERWTIVALAPTGAG